MEIIDIELALILLAELMYLAIFKHSGRFNLYDYFIGFAFRIFTLGILLIQDFNSGKSRQIDFILITNTMGQMLIQTYLPSLKKHIKKENDNA